MMEEDTSLAGDDRKINTVPLKNNSIPIIETNGVSGSISLGDNKAASASTKSGERIVALGGVSNVSTKVSEASASCGVITSFSRHDISQSFGTQPQNSGFAKSLYSYPGTNGNNNNNNVDESKPSSSVPGIMMRDSHSAPAPGGSQLKNPQSSLQAGSTDVKTNSYPVPSTLSSLANTAKQEPFPGMDTGKAADGQIPVSTTRLDEGKRLTKLAPGGSPGLLAAIHQDHHVGQRLSPSNFHRPGISQRLSPAQHLQMSTSDMIHSASSLIHGSDMQGLSPHPEAADRRGQSPSNQRGAPASHPTNRPPNDTHKKGNSPGSASLKCQDVTSNQLKNYLMAPTQGRSGNQSAMTTNSVSPHPKDVYPPPNQPPGTHLHADIPQQSGAPASKPAQKPPRKRKSKAASAKAQSPKSSTLLGDDDDDNDFIPVGMVQLSTLRRPTDNVPVQQQNQLLKEQLQLGQHQSQQYNQRSPAVAAVPQHQAPPPVERKEIDSRTQQHQLLLQLVQQVQQAQQQKQLLEQQRQQQQQHQEQQQQQQYQHPQQSSPHPDQLQSNLLQNTNVKLQEVQKNQGLVIRHFQQESVPGGPERQMLPSESQTIGADNRPQDQRIRNNPQQQIPSSSSSPSLSSILQPSSSLSYTSPSPQNGQPQGSTKNIAQGTQPSSIPKIAEQLLQQPPSDQQLYPTETRCPSGRDDQRGSKVELYLLHSRAAETSQPGVAHPLQSPSPTWQGARSSTPTTPTLSSGQHSHQHPEISRMLCSPVSPRQSASSPRASVSPRRTESPFQPPSSPCQFVSPKQPVSPHSRMASSFSAATSSSASKPSVAGQGPVRNNSNQPGNQKVTYTRQNSSPRPLSSPWQPISPSQISASNSANFTAVQKPHPTLGHVSVGADHQQDPSRLVSSALSPSSTSINPQPCQSPLRNVKYIAGFESQAHMLPQQIQHQNQTQSVGLAVPSTLQYGQSNRSPSSPRTTSKGDIPAQSLNPGQVIHHLPAEQPISGGSFNPHEHVMPPASMQSSGQRIPKPSAQNASPIWQQMQHQHQQPYQEGVSTSCAPQMPDTSKTMGILSSQPVDIQRLAQQHHQRQHQQQMTQQNLRSPELNQGLNEPPQGKQASVLSAQGHPQSAPSGTHLGHVPDTTAPHEQSKGFSELSEKESRLIQSFFPNSETTRSEEALENDPEKKSSQQNQEPGDKNQQESITQEEENKSQAGPQDVRKNEGALQVLSEIASKRYEQAVESEKHDQKEDLDKKDDSKNSSSQDKNLAEGSGSGEKTVRPGRSDVNSKADEQIEKKKEVSNETPKREVRQRKPKKPFEQEETPSRRNPRTTPNQKVSNETPNKKSTAPASPSRSHKKGQGKKSTSVSSKSDTEQDGKPAASSKFSSKAETNTKRPNRRNGEADSGSEEDSETESAEPRRLSRRLQVKKEERRKQKSSGTNADDEGSNQRRSHRIATRVDYKEETSENTSEEVSSGRQQQPKELITETEDKSGPTGSLVTDAGDKVATRSRNSRKDTTKDPPSSRSTSSSRREANSQKFSENSKDKGGGVASSQNTPTSKVPATTSKSEPQLPIDRKMRTRNRSKSRSRSPLTAGVQEASTPLTRRNMAARKGTGGGIKSTENDTVSSKRIAPTEFVDELPPWRSYQKKEEMTSDTMSEQPSQGKFRRTHSDDKNKVATVKVENKKSENERVERGRKGRRTPVSKTKPQDSEDKEEPGDPQSSESPKTEEPPSTAHGEKGSTSRGKTTKQAKKSEKQKAEHDVKPKGPSLLEKTFEEADEHVPTTTSRSSSLSSHTFPAEAKLSLKVQGKDSPRQADMQEEKAGVGQLPEHSASHDHRPAKENQDTRKASQSGQRQPHQPRMVVYRLVPVLDEDTSAAEASSLLPVSGYFMSSAGGGRILLPENFMQGPAASQEISSAVLKSLVPPSSQHLLQHQQSQHLPSKSHPVSTHLSSPFSQSPALASSSSDTSLSIHKEPSLPGHQHPQAPPISPLRTALSSPLHQQPPPSLSPAAWSTPHQVQQSPLSNHQQGQWVPGQGSHHSRGAPSASTVSDMGGSTSRQNVVAATPPPPHSPHISSAAQSQHLRQQYQQHQASPAPPYRPSPSWNPTPPSMPSSSPQLPSSSSSSSSVWNLASPSSIPQHQQQQQVPFTAQHHQQVPLQQPVPQQQHGGLQHQHQAQRQQQQPWVSPQHQMMEEQAWRSDPPGDNSTASVAVESWSKQFLPNPPLYNTGSALGQQGRVAPEMDVRPGLPSNQIPQPQLQQSTVYSEDPHQLPHQQGSANASNMYAPPAVPQQQPQQQQQQQDPAEFSDAKADQIIQNFLRSAAGSGGGFGQDLAGFNLGQQDMAYLDSRLRLSPNSLMSAVVAAYEEDNLEECGIGPSAGNRGRGTGSGSTSQHPDNNNSLQDTINLVHTVNLVDLEDDVNLGLGGMSASHSSRSSGVISPRSGGLDSPLLALGGRVRTGSFHDPMVDSPSVQPPVDAEANETVPTGHIQPEQKAGPEGDKADEDAKTKPKDRKHQYKIVHEDGQRKFTCLACDKIFSGATIYRHLRTHDPDHKVSCKVCGRTYTQRSTLIMHMCKNHGYIHTPKTEKKKDLNTSDQKEEGSSTKKDEKKSAKSSKSSGLASSKKSPGQAVKSPPGSGKSSADSKRQRRSSSQSPSNPLAPGLDQEEREIHQATQRQVEEQRRLKAEQKQRKAAGEMVVTATGGAGKSLAADSTDGNKLGGGESEDISSNSKDQAESGSSTADAVPTQSSTTANNESLEKTGQPSSVSAPQKNESKKQDGRGKDAPTPSTKRPNTSKTPTKDSKVSESQSGQENKGQTSSADLDELIAAVASGAGNIPSSLPEDLDLQEEIVDRPPEANTDSKVLIECLERESEPVPSDIFSPILKKAEDGTDRYGCPLCPRILASRNSFSLHIRRHKDEKTKVCKFCSKTFHTGQELKSHERTHTGEKPYKCEICFSSFSHFGSSVIHKKSHAARGETEPFPIVNGEIQYPASFKKPRSNSTERKESSGSPKRKRIKKSSGDQNVSGEDARQEGVNSGPGQPFRRGSLDVSTEREQTVSDPGTPNRRHSLNDQVLSSGNAMETGISAFVSPMRSSVPQYQTPPNFDNSFNSQTSHGSTPDQQSFYGTPAGYAGAPAQGQVGNSGQQPSQYFTPPAPLPSDQQGFRSSQSPQENYFSPQHPGQTSQQRHQPDNTGSGYPQPIQRQRPMPPGFVPRVSGVNDNVSGQPFKSSSPSTEIVKSLLQHYNLSESQPSGEFSHQAQYPQEQQNYGSPLAYPEQPQQQLQQVPGVGYQEQGQQTAAQLNYQGPNPPPYNTTVQGQQQQFYSSPQHQLQQPPMYPGPGVNRSGQFSPQHQMQQPQQSPQHQTFHQQQQPQQSPQHQTFNKQQQPPQHQTFSKQPQQSPQHQTFHQQQQPQQSPQHQTFNKQQQPPQHQTFSKQPQQSPQHQTFHQQQQPQQSPQHQTFHQQQQPQQSPQQQTFSKQQQPPQQSQQHQIVNQPQGSPHHQNLTQQHQSQPSSQHQIFPHQQQQPQQGPQHQSLHQHQQKNLKSVTDDRFYQQSQPGSTLSAGIQSSGPQIQNPQNLQPLPKISSLARDLPRS